MEAEVERVKKEFEEKQQKKKEKEKEKEKDDKDKKNEEKDEKAQEKVSNMLAYQCSVTRGHRYFLMPIAYKGGAPYSQPQRLDDYKC